MKQVKILLIAVLTAASLTVTTEAIQQNASKTRTSKTTTAKNKKTQKTNNNIYSDYETEIPENNYREDPPRSMNDYLNSSHEENAVDMIAVDASIETVSIEDPLHAVPATDNGEKVYESAEQRPIFPGGDAALIKYVHDHLRYPAAAQENGIQGRVLVQFVVKKDGSIGQVKVIRSKDPDLDNEAVRIVKSLPKFTPGKINGHSVNVWYTLPITFRM